MENLGRGGNRFAKGSSPTRFDNPVAVLPHVLDQAIECGAIYLSPVSTLKHKPTRHKIAYAANPRAIRRLHPHNAGGRDSRNCANLAQCLAFTGCRLREAG